MKKIALALVALAVMAFADVKTVVVTPEILSDKTLQIVDVRTPAEWAQTGVVKEAVKVSYTSENGVNENFVNELKAAGIDPNKPVALLCHSGNRSKKAAKLLDEAGFKNIIDLDGGVTRLENEYKYPLVKE
ncbi:rhodanese-like domain-containing protein [Campylobacter geochelonis]|uniref:rhodanese-like domain-containing protein n=1 Tax=Campylobacter geochelonis TaxID=1780362 RepID=UPI000770A12D|nr:rhodanese-like domain-containing protein [Campylobacter geochelonis]CZE48159.1 thiosulfate sulfurtransferase [Campylobacter geochelonis]